MRTIKFRGRCISGDSVGKWFRGDLSTDRLKDGKCTIWDENNPFSGCYVDPDTVGQFTGCLDFFGNEIYEGDILHHKGSYFGVVQWHQDGYFFINDRLNISSPVLDSFRSLGEMTNKYPFVVYSNIHEIPTR